VKHHLKNSPPSVRKKQSYITLTPVCALHAPRRLQELPVEAEQVQSGLGFAPFKTRAGICKTAKAHPTNTFLAESALSNPERDAAFFGQPYAGSFVNTCDYSSQREEPFNVI
jgi:hypothetical protein